MGPRKMWKAWQRWKVSRVRGLPARRHLFGGTLGMSLLVATGSALGQSADQQEEIALPGLNVGARRPSSYRSEQPALQRLPESYLDIPQSVTVVTKDLMREQAVFSLRDSLRNVTGIALQAGEGGGAQGDNLSLRGYPARSDIYLDGVRDVGQYQRDVFNLESIDVLKGPSAVFFGRGSTGGIINQVSKLPQRERFYDFSLTAGNGPLVRGVADLNQPIGNTMALRLNLMGTWGEPVGRDEIDFSRLGVAPSFAWGLGTSTLLTANYYYAHEDNLPDYGLPIVTYPGQVGEPPDIDRSLFYGLPDKDTERTNVHIATLTLDHRFNEHVSIRDVLRYSYADRLARVTPPRILTVLTPTTPLSDIVVNRNRPGRDADESILSNQLEALVKFDTWMLKHRLVTGVDASWQTFDQTNLVNTPGGPTPLLDPAHFPPIPITSVPGTRFESNAWALGVYAVDEVQIVQWLKVLAGLRWDYFDAEIENLAATGARTSRFTSTDSMLAPRVALVVQPTNWQTYYVSWGRSFNPSAEQLNSLNLANQSAEPERTEAYEVGAKWDLLKGALGITTALFRIDKTNARTVDPTTGIATLDGHTRSQGWELGVTGRPLPGWNIFFGYTLLDTKILEAFEVNTEGKKLANAPEHTLSLWTTYDFLERWQVGTGVFYSSSRFGNNTNTSRVPGYVRWDLTAAYQVNRNVGLRFNIVNVMDTTYYDRAHPGHAIPGDGRTFLLTGTFSF